MRIKDCQREITWEIAVQDVFEHHKDVPFYHAATLAFLDRDRVAVACFAGSFEGKDDVRIVLTKQDETGAFSSLIRFGGEENAACWNPVLHRGGIGQDDDQLELYFKHGRTIADWITLRSISADKGETWTEPEELVPGDRSGGRGPVKDKILRLSDGTWLAGMSVERENWKAGVDRSEDEGKTWAAMFLPEPCLSEYAKSWIRTDNNMNGLIQPTLWESAPGQVHMFLRSTYGHIYRSDSTDYGRTWCAPYETEMVNNNSGIDVVKLKDRVFLVCNPVENGDISSPRSPLSIFVSRDNGFHFELFHVLESEPGAYAYPAIITDGENLHVTYTWNNKTIKYVKLTCKGET